MLLLNLTTDPEATDKTGQILSVEVNIDKEKLRVFFDTHPCTSTYAVLFFLNLGGGEFDNPGVTSASGLHSYRTCYPDYASAEEIKNFCGRRPRLSVYIPLTLSPLTHPFDVLKPFREQTKKLF